MTIPLRGLPRLYDSSDDLAFDEETDPGQAYTLPGGGIDASYVRSFLAVVADELELELEDTRPFVRGEASTKRRIA